MLMSSEQFLHHFLPNEDAASGKALYPKLLYCLTTCLEILDSILDLKNPDDNAQTVWYFIHPASYFFGGVLPQAYKNKVKYPMDFGTITSNLIEGAYQSVDAFVKDCRLVTSNCKAFYQDDKENGKAFVAQANRLEEFLSPHLSNILKYDEFEKGSEGRKNAANPTPISLLKPTPAFYTAILNELRSANYTDRYTKVRRYKINENEPIP